MNFRFNTTNSAKFEAARSAFADHGLTIVQCMFDFVEPQHEDVEQIVLAKLRQSRATGSIVTVVEDTSIGFTALNGFPGPYVKYAHSTLGNEGLLRLMDPELERTVIIDSVCGAALPGRSDPILTRTLRTHYRVRTSVNQHDSSSGWSDIWTILEIAAATSESELAEPTSIQKMAALLANLPTTSSHPTQPTET